MSYTLKKMFMSKCHFLLKFKLQQRHSQGFLGLTKTYGYWIGTVYVHLSAVCACYWLHSKKIFCPQKWKVLLLWQVGLIATVKLHFFFILLPGWSDSISMSEDMFCIFKSFSLHMWHTLGVTLSQVARCLPQICESW